MQNSLFDLTEAQPEMAVPADTAKNGVEDQPQPETALPPGYWQMYQVNGAGDIPDALKMFKNRWGIPARLLIWPGCEFGSDNGLKIEESELLRKGWLYVA